MRICWDLLPASLFTMVGILLIPMASAQTKLQQAESARVFLLIDEQPLAPSAAIARPAPLPHHFWDRTNILLFSVVAASRALDYASTKNMLARGRQEILIPDDIVYSSAGFPSLEAAATATSVGFSYLLHRTGHHKLERWLSVGHIGVTDFGAARNYSLKSRRR
jgi:hypothetical protein